MAYAILRARKMKTAGQMAGMQRHNDRTNNVRNADSDLEHLNINHSLYDTGSIYEDVTKHIEEKEVKGVRSDSVKCIELLLTASPEFFPTEKYQKEDGTYDLRGLGMERWEKFQEKAFDFLEEEFGGDNVVNFSCHFDEKTPHIHAYVVPVVEKTRHWKNKSKNGVIKKGKTVSNGLSAADYLGDKEKLRTLQTKFWAKVSDLGLQRGKEGSLATHENIQKYYKRVNDACEKELAMKDFVPEVPSIEIPTPDKIMMNPKKWQEEVQIMVNKAMMEANINGAQQLSEQFAEEMHRFMEYDKIEKGFLNRIKNTEEASDELIKTIEKDAKDAIDIAEKKVEIAKKNEKHWENEAVMRGQTLEAIKEQKRVNDNATVSFAKDVVALMQDPQNLEKQVRVTDFLKQNNFIKGSSRGKGPSIGQ